ncbi:hypothetical protein PVK06_030724 [Gossypium arboreum]|uniref:Uncharacterized protein n=1 Tax=Gossypium arboreum TaxID=29729 RepID=A0ABR0NP16_GOSAR|nr:hypothetical protein PVK06_030724 [Gossypium arboreum]
MLRRIKIENDVKLRTDEPITLGQTSLKTNSKGSGIMKTLGKSSATMPIFIAVKPEQNGSRGLPTFSSHALLAKTDSSAKHSGEFTIKPNSVAERQPYWRLAPVLWAIWIHSTESALRRDNPNPLKVFHYDRELMLKGIYKGSNL